MFTYSFTYNRKVVIMCKREELTISHWVPTIKSMKNRNLVYQGFTNRETIRQQTNMKQNLFRHFLNIKTKNRRDILQAVVTYGKTRK